MRRTAHRKAILASLFGTGAALVSASPAEAGIVYKTVGINIGFAQNDVASYTISLPHGGATISRSATPTFGTLRLIHLAATAAKTFHQKAFLSTGIFDRPYLANAGQKWSTVATSHTPTGLTDADIEVGTSAGRFQKGLFSDKYFLFSFQNGATTDYGWIFGSETDDTFANMTYHLDAYAFDDTGAQLPAGDTGIPPVTVPEPSTLVVGTMMAALTIGAAGVRRWRAARQAVATGSV